MTYRFWAALLFLATMASCWLLGSWAGYRTLEKESLEEAFRYSQLVANELNRYRPIPELMAEHPLMESVLRQPTDELLVLQANEEMKKMAQIVGSSDVYLMDSTGFTIAANNYQQDDSFIGRIFDFRPYFQDAMRTRDTAIYFALGTTSDIRGLYFSHPVKTDRDRILGVIAVKVQVNDLESQWQRPVALNHAEMVVLDDEGISFLSSRDEWLYRDFEPRSVTPHPNLRYPNRDLTPIELISLGRPIGVSARSTLLRVEERGINQEYLSVRMPLPQLDWTLQVMIETRQVVWIRLQFLAAGFVIFLGCFLTWLYLRERYKREAELAQRGIVLERRVTERTADLENSNRKLLDEIRQREEAQTELKETQQELIQAAKLAVLGQMSAGLNHEMNQPLTAIQAYARNSRRFLERGDSTMVDANLLEISHLCDKMAELTRQFKVFARKSEGPPSSVDLRQPVDAALKIITAQESSEGVTIDWQRPDKPIMCHGDMIRIEQVLVNLIANANQAVEGRDDPRVSIDILEKDDEWQCRIRDNGPGLPAQSEQVFEPFFTTKSMKQGLGLGLSISRQIVDALGGRLTGHNRDDGAGAEFVVTLSKREVAE